MDDLLLVAAFVKSANVTELRAALHLPADLGALEANFTRAASLVFEHIGKRSPSEPPTISNFARSWTDAFNEDLRECRRVIDAALAH